MRRLILIMLCSLSLFSLEAQKNNQGAKKINIIVYGRESLTIQHPNAELVRYNLSPRTRLKLTLSYAFSLGDQIKRARTESAATISLDKPIL